MFKFCSNLSIIACLALTPIAGAHFLWQQEVRSTAKKSSLAFTFAETPGIDHAEREQMAQAAFAKGVEAWAIETGEGGITSANFNLNLDGKYITSQLPEEVSEQKSYAFEGFCEWGIFAEGGASPSLLRYYTSVSHIERPTKEISWSNKFRVEMIDTHHSQKCAGQGTNDHQSTCIQVKVIYSGIPVPQTEITLHHGDADAVKLMTDQEGLTYTSIPLAEKRVFARANYKLEAALEAKIDGTSYDTINNWAAATLELSPDRMTMNEDVNPKDEGPSSSTKVEPTSPTASTSDSTKSRSSSSQEIIDLALLAFVGSFFGSMILGWMKSRSFQNGTSKNRCSAERQKLGVDKELVID